MSAAAHSILLDFYFQGFESGCGLESGLSRGRVWRALCGKPAADASDEYTSWNVSYIVTESRCLEADTSQGVDTETQAGGQGPVREARADRPPPRGGRRRPVRDAGAICAFFPLTLESIEGLSLSLSRFLKFPNTYVRPTMDLVFEWENPRATAAASRLRALSRRTSRLETSSPQKFTLGGTPPQLDRTVVETSGGRGRALRLSAASVPTTSIYID